MSVATKFARRRWLFVAYQIGRLAAQREEWMRLAREEKSLRKSPDLIKQSVRYARQRNRELVQQLREVRV